MVLCFPVCTLERRLFGCLVSDQLYPLVFPRHVGSYFVISEKRPSTDTLANRSKVSETRALIKSSMNMVSCKITEEQSFEGQSVTCQERGDRGKTLMGLRSANKERKRQTHRWPSERYGEHQCLRDTGLWSARSVPVSGARIHLRGPHSPARERARTLSTRQKGARSITRT